MKLILFSKMLKDRSIDALADLAASLGIDGYDLAVRPGHPVNPDNVAEALPRAAATLRARGFDIPMITANTDLVDATAVIAESVAGNDQNLIEIADTERCLHFVRLELRDPPMNGVDLHVIAVIGYPGEVGGDRVPTRRGRELGPCHLSLL